MTHLPAAKRNRTAKARRTHRSFTAKIAKNAKNIAMTSHD